MPPHVFVPTATRARVFPDYLVTSTPPTSAETVAEHGIGANFDRTRKLSVRAKTSRMPMVSAPVTACGKQESAVQSEEEYAGMITHGDGSSVKGGGHGERGTASRCTRATSGGHPGNTPLCQRHGQKRQEVAHRPERKQESRRRQLGRACWQNCQGGSWAKQESQGQRARSPPFVAGG